MWAGFVLQKSIGATDKAGIHQLTSAHKWITERQWSVLALYPLLTVLSFPEALQCLSASEYSENGNNRSVQWFGLLVVEREKRPDRKHTEAPNKKDYP